MTVLEHPAILPDVFARWFAGRGWVPRAHQLDLLTKAGAGRSVLLIAPTGGGKTLAGFLPSLVELGGTAVQPVPPPAGQAPACFHRPQRSPRRRAAYALHLAAQGARGRYRAQSRSAGRRDAAPDPDRDPHRRYAGLETPAPAPRSAGYSAHDAGAARAAAGIRRCAVSVRLAEARDPRRIARARHFQARRSSVARPGAAVPPGAGLTSIGLSATVARAGELARFLVPQQQDATQRGAHHRRRRRTRPTSPCWIRASGCPGPATRRATRSTKFTG